MRLMSLRKRVISVIFSAPQHHLAVGEDVEGFEELREGHIIG
jgi:hypothetical protein